MKKYLLILLLWAPALQAHNFLSSQQAQKAWQDRDYDKAREILEKALVHKPQDPELNFNMGNVYHMIGMFDAATENYARVIAQESTSDDLREQSLFNLANTGVQKAQAILGQRWEQRNIDAETLDEAGDCLLGAIDHYNDVLAMKHEDERAAANRAYAQDLYERIQQKKQQENKNEPQNKKQKQDAKRNKDSQGDQGKQQDSQPQPDSAEKGSPRPGSKNDAQQDNADQDSGSAGDMERETEPGHQAGGDDRSEDRGKSGENGNDNSPGAGAAVGDEQAQAPVDQEQQAMLALLHSLDAKEAEKHKAFIAKHVQNQAGSVPGQKNW